MDRITHPRWVAPEVREDELTLCVHAYGCVPTSPSNVLTRYTSRPHKAVIILASWEIKPWERACLRLSAWLVRNGMLTNRMRTSFQQAPRLAAQTCD